MLLNVVGASFQVSVSFGEIGHQQVLDQGLGVFGEVPRKFNLTFQNILIHCHWVIVREGVDADLHLVNQDSQAPPVHRLAVAFLQQNFRREVLGGSTEGVCPTVDMLCETEIRQLQIPFFID